MVELDIVFSGKVKHKGIFDFKGTYGFCWEWLTDKGYWVTEKTYSEKMSGTGKEVEIQWDCYRKISDYFRFKLEIKWHVIAMNDVEVEQDGKKITLQKSSTFEMRLSSIIEKDYESRWEGKPFFKFLRGIYDRYIVVGRIEKYEDKIFEEADEYLAQVKAFMAMQGNR